MVVALVPMPRGMLLVLVVIAEMMGTNLLLSRAAMKLGCILMMLLIRLRLILRLLTMALTCLVWKARVLLFDRLIVQGLRVPTPLMILCRIRLARITWMMLTVLGAAICNLL